MVAARAAARARTAGGVVRGPWMVHPSHPEAGDRRGKLVLSVNGPHSRNRGGAWHSACVDAAPQRLRDAMLTGEVQILSGDASDACVGTIHQCVQQSTVGKDEGNNR